MKQRFRYMARGIDGRRMSGSVAAISPEAATVLLQEAGVYVTSVVPVPSQRHRPPAFGQVYLTEEERIFLLESWAMFLEAGLSMQVALLRIRLKARNPALIYAIEEMEEAIDSGEGFEEALKRSCLFSPSWIGILASGATRGDFIRPIRMLHQEVVEFRRTKRELLSMLLPPLILLGLVAVWAFVFVLRVVPCIEDFLIGASLVPQMIGVLVIGARVLRWGVGLIPFAAFFVGLVSWAARRTDQEGRFLFMWLPTSIPVVGPLVSQMHLMTITSGLHLQLEAGIPLKAALQTLAQGVRNAGVRKDLVTVCQLLEEGVPFSQAIVQLRIFPSMSRALMAAGTSSGKLPEMLAFISKEAQVTLAEQVKRLTVYIRSFVVLTTGLLIGLLMLTFLGLFFSSMGSMAQSVVSQRSVPSLSAIP